MNKKLIIAIIAGVVALALIVTAAVVIIKKVNINAPDDGGSSSTPTSSVSSDKGDGNKGGTPSDSTPVVDKGNVTIGDFEGKTGDIIDVPIKLSENPGILAGMFIFEFDSKALEYVDYEKGDILNIVDEDDVIATAGTVSCLMEASELKDTTKNGTLITLQFKVKDGAAKGDYTIKYSSESQISNFNEEWIKPQISDGKITVK